MNRKPIGLKKNSFVGIGGIGMSGLAQVMKTMGFKVQGSDLAKVRMLKGVKKLYQYLINITKKILKTLL